MVSAASTSAAASLRDWRTRKSMAFTLQVRTPTNSLAAVIEVSSRITSWVVVKHPDLNRWKTGISVSKKGKM